MVAEPFQSLLMFLCQQMPLDLRPRFLECRHPLFGMLIQLGDVKSERRAKHRADFTRLQREHDCIEFGNHFAAREPAKIATAARTIGQLIGNGLERVTRLDSLFRNSNGSQSGILRGFLVDVLDDVRSANGLRHRHIVAMVPIIFDNILIAGRSDAAGVSNRQALDAELEFGLSGITSCFFDHLGGHRFCIGERGLAQENSFNHVIARPFLRARFDGGWSFAGHCFGKPHAKRADLLADYIVLDQFIVDSQWQTAIVLNAAQRACERPGRRRVDGDVIDSPACGI
jgi:hypothetical protein